MDKNVKLKRTVQKREDLDKVVKSQFTTFLQPEVEVDTDTVEELFRLYDKLYLEIPVIGETNSHEYLIARSSELVNVDLDNEAIQPLLEEISDLRTELLAANQEIANLNIKLANGGN